MKNQKVIVTPNYYEVHILPFDKKTMTPQYYMGVSGLFMKRKNVFKSLDTALNYLQKRKFDDSVCIGESLSSSISEGYNLNIYELLEKLNK